MHRYTFLTYRCTLSVAKMQRKRKTPFFFSGRVNNKNLTYLVFGTFNLLFNTVNK